MGYACPVCEEVQVDAEHLANHLAFTAILRAGAHEEWLDDHVPEWQELGPADLGPKVSDTAEEVEVDIPANQPTPQPDRARHPGRSGPSGGRLSEEDRAILEEARDLTRRMYEDARPGEDSGEMQADGQSNEDPGGENDTEEVQTGKDDAEKS